MTVRVHPLVSTAFCRSAAHWPVATWAEWSLLLPVLDRHRAEDLCKDEGRKAFERGDPPRYDLALYMGWSWAHFTARRG